MRGYRNLLLAEEEGRRPRNYQEAERRKRREEKGSRWYRKEGRSTSVREGMFIIPPTPGGVLAKGLRKICQEELQGTNIFLTVVKRGGRRLGQELACTVPGKSVRKHCGREKCSPCNTGTLGVCRRTGLGYQIDCFVCASNNSSMVSRYAGETVHAWV